MSMQDASPQLNFSPPPLPLKPPHPSFQLPYFYIFKHLLTNPFTVGTNNLELRHLLLIKSHYLFIVKYVGSHDHDFQK